MRLLVVKWRADRLMAPRRWRDDDGEYHEERRRGGGLSSLNGHTKWVVGAFGSLLLAAVVALASRDRASIDREQAIQNDQIKALQMTVQQLATTAAASQATGEQWRAEVLRRLDRIEKAVQ